MLAVLGLLTIIVLLAAILSQKMSTLTALVAVSVSAALIGGIGAYGEVGAALPPFVSRAAFAAGAWPILDALTLLFDPDSFYLGVLPRMFNR
jgi:Mg2+/citrate symporter